MRQQAVVVSSCKQASLRLYTGVRQQQAQQQAELTHHCTGTSGMFSSGGCAWGLSSFNLRECPHRVLPQHLGDAAALGQAAAAGARGARGAAVHLQQRRFARAGPQPGREQLKSHHGGQHAAVRGPRHVPVPQRQKWGCLEAGVVRGQRRRASTVTIVGTTSRLYFGAGLGFYPGGAAPVAWAYALPPATATGAQRHASLRRCCGERKWWDGQ